MSADTALARLQVWYRSHCDGDWEHSYGVKIDTLDNPGWTVKIDLRETGLENRPFEEVKLRNELETDWLICRKTDFAFEGAGDPGKLEQIIEIFLKWTDSNQQ